ncbi:MAG: hypothetical protein EXS37_10845 [Opitutus sp.]|nr:hypothetical protein [Opitutus sp.]
MTPSPDHHEKLEQLIHRTLRDLPPRRAPQSLEARVLAELARRAALPWWRKSFVNWPVPARAGFLVLSVGVVKLVLIAAVWVMAGFDTAQFRDAFTQPFAWMETGLAVVNAISGFADIMLRNIPPLWLYGGIAIIASLYATLFGLGTVAYKALHAQR